MRLEELKQKYNVMFKYADGSYAINTSGLVELFLKLYSTCKFNKEYHVFNSKTGLWEIKDKGDMKVMIASILSDFEKKFWTPKVREKILEYLDIQVPEYIFDEEKHLNLLPMHNLILDVRTRKTMAYSPEYFFRTKCKFDYQPDAEAPNFQKFLKSSCEENELLMKMLLELLGLCLTNRAEKQQIYYLWGNGCNGKSIYLFVARELVSEGNYVSLEPSQLENRFAKVQLENKKLLVLGDLSKKDSRNIISSQIKSITGGEKISAEIKFKGNIEFVSHLKILATSNYLPIPEGDSTFGDERRIFLIPFTHQVTENEKDEFLREKLVKEMPGILNLALEGLGRLHQNRYQFSFDGQKVWREILRKEYPLKSFVSQMVVSCKGNFVRYTAFEEAFYQWCAENDVDGGNYSSFELSKEVTNHFHNTKKEKRGGFRGILNVKLQNVSRGSVKHHKKSD